MWEPTGKVNALPTDNCTIGLFDYNDDGLTTVSHIGGVDSPLPNNELGAFTNKLFPPSGITDVWDALNGEFDFSQLKLGDMIDVRVDLEVTTAAVSQEVELDIELGQGGFAYRLPMLHLSFKSTGVKRISAFYGIYLGDLNTLNNKGQLIFSSSDNATIKVNGWYCKVLIRG